MKIWNDNKLIAINAAKVVSLKIKQEMPDKILVYAYLVSGARQQVRTFKTIDEAREFVQNVELQ